MKKSIKPKVNKILNKKINLNFFKFFIINFLIVILFLNAIKSQDTQENNKENINQNIKYREGIIKYISKPTIISKPFILLSTNERFYITNELYQNLINIQNIVNNYYYLKAVNNIVYAIDIKPFRDYTYEFPKIFRINTFEFKDHNIIYILFYYNLSEFVNIEAKSDDNKKLYIYYTSPNSISVKISKNRKLKYIKLILTYSNPYFSNLNFKKEYTINQEVE